ncbi:hypothetical protein NQ314_002592 [Rhamnusium bicolor]|uniref:SMP-30/Gluconolactonase/LRE-like region domain-containing protein n=1 Tax=Rhamnusium bicolor TaxID=1586634 RepID=A0AAV8ZRC4_9CUCU|nr:hypothetical protein NQ314_002592 [Rhamnusium bicolor]
MAPEIEKLIEAAIVELAEGPHWDAETQSLYFVDVTGQYIHKYVPSTKKHTKARIGKNVSFIIPVQGKNDQFVISTDREITLITWDGESEEVSNLQKLYEVDENIETAINDGKCDPSGRLWAGIEHILGNPSGLYGYVKLN